ncbi:diadenosine tetraphosphate hydrolase [Pseudomonas sp. MYb2]|uniref:HIT family protein n=1 Tax=unclassified Pseudomonas TaxID=196821 RepID=UPI000D001275|nr:MULTISPECIES: HIT family protein [unclassified Pseudomonas]PRB52513.1 diadenosine tetraphosphate hydrolase [Pseudomonas sp. MYb3]PRC35025.1 diadenosine tetraphosphate hydrolase [Pseudomonas sp. MYb2]
MDCIFCKMISGDAPMHLIWEDDAHLAFLSIYPNTPGFSVVVPKQHYSSYAFAQSDEVLSALIVAAKKVALLIDKTFADVGRTGLILEGYGIDHLHAKLFPMHGTGDSSHFKPISSNMGKFFDHYEGYISSHDYKGDVAMDLAEIARRIRRTADLEG